MTFPALLLHRSLASDGAQLSMADCARALLTVLAAAIAAKLLLEGPATLPQYPKARGCTTVGEEEHHQLLHTKMLGNLQCLSTTIFCILPI